MPSARQKTNMQHERQHSSCPSSVYLHLFAKEKQNSSRQFDKTILGTHAQIRPAVTPGVARSRLTDLELVHQHVLPPRSQRTQHALVLLEQGDGQPQQVIKVDDVAPSLGSAETPPDVGHFLQPL